MSDWADPCVRAEELNGAHNFVPVPTERKTYIGNLLIMAICSKCGVYR